MSKKPETIEDIEVPSITFQRIIVTEEQIMSSWKAIEKDIKSLDYDNTAEDT